MTRALGLLEHGQENGALGLEGCHVEDEVASFPRALLHCASISMYLFPDLVEDLWPREELPDWSRTRLGPCC